jgi:hypothetical protein
MLQLISDNLWMILTTVIVIIAVLYYKSSSNIETRSIFLKDKNSLRKTIVSGIENVSHDTIKLTLDFPNIYSELGLPLGIFISLF